jgi:N-acetylneuraminate synthase
MACCNGCSLFCQWAYINYSSNTCLRVALYRLREGNLPVSTEPQIKIGNHLIGGDEPCFIIAEIGINHNGDIKVAKKLIDIAVDAGVDAVKFQKRTVDVVYTPEELDRPRESPLGETNRELKDGLEFGFDHYSEIDRYCKEKGILWFASCWDEASVDFIDQFDPPCYKIASASLTDGELLKYTASNGKPLILSTGMSSMAQIRAAVKIVRESLGNNFIVMHCVSTYPTRNQDLNLRTITAFKEEFDVPIGYSGHESGVVPSVMAAVLGASTVERHITIDRAMWGSDQAASLEPPGLRLLTRDIHVWGAVRGTGVKQVLDAEAPIIEKLRRKDTLSVESGA